MRNCNNHKTVNVINFFTVIVIAITKKTEFILDLFTVKLMLKHTFEGSDYLLALKFSFTDPTHVTSILPIIIEGAMYLSKAFL